jgi:hypothetical protein
MKRWWFAIFALCSALGCAQQKEIPLSTITPASAVPRQPATDGGLGTLVVYSAWRRTGTDDPDHRVHSSYDVLTDDRKPFLHVQNFVTPMVDDPASVRLSPGKYIVKTRVQRHGFVSIPVVIDSHRTTVLYLDNTTHPEQNERETAETVKLPDGHVIGWASAAN